jgi:NADPH:quinone reductase-like Zn-dependent oxidoreductase
MAATTNAVRVHAFGGSDALKIEAVPLPDPKDDELVVKVMAASINPVDFKIRNGTYPRVKAEHLPRTLGRDLSGIVETAGPACGFKPGDAIYAFLGPDRGGNAERVLIKPNEAAAKPKSLDHVQAAAVPLAAITAWQGLFDVGGLKAGERVLIHAGNGGVGHLAVQFAKAKGAWVATTCSGVDREFVKGLGADQVIDYRAERFEEMVRPVDLVLDLVAGESRARSWFVIKKGGRLASALGLSDADQAKATEAGVKAQMYVAKVSSEQLGEIAALIDAGKVKVEVQDVFAFRDVARAQDKLEKEHTRGKIVLDLTR